MLSSYGVPPIFLFITTLARNDLAGSLLLSEQANIGNGGRDGMKRT
jgi:hypothetical protein